MAENSNTSFWDSFKDRAKSPMYSTFIISWSLWNWKMIYYFISVNEKVSFHQRMNELNNLYFSKSNMLGESLGEWISNKTINLYIIPLLITCIVVFGIDRFISNRFARYSTGTKQIRIDERTEIQNAELLSTIRKEGDSLKEHINVLNKFIDETHNIELALLQQTKEYDLFDKTSKDDFNSSQIARKNVIEQATNNLNNRPKTIKYS